MKRSTLRLLTFTAAACASIACAEPPVVPSTAPVAIAPFRVLAIGGGLEDNNKVLFDLMRSSEADPKTIIVPFASGEQENAFKRMRERFEANGWKGRILRLPDPVTSEEFHKTAVEWLPNSHLIFFTGGDQSRIMQRMVPPYADVRQALDAGMKRYGALIAGTSAGAAVLSDPMFTGGGSESALAGTAPNDGEKEEKPASQAKDQPPKRKPGVQLAPGFGIVAPIMDTHFFPRGRVGRLVAALEASKRPFGLGVDENRGVWFNCPDSFRAYQSCTALLVDARELSRKGLSRIGARVSLLSDGDAWSMPDAKGQTSGVISPRKLTSVAVALAAPAAPDKTPDAWGKNVFLDMLKRLAANPTQPQRAQSDKFTIELSADERTQFGWSADAPEQLTIINARLDILERESVEKK
jgi:cyanophycinase